MSARDYYPLTRPSASAPASQAPQSVTRPPETPPQAAPLPQTAPVVPPSPAPEARADQPVVALLLPLTGPNAAVGKALFDAAAIAMFDVGDEDFVLLPRDTGGTPEGAATAARDALAAGARLIIGPLLAAEAPAVAEVARGVGVNVISLSNDRTVAGGNLFILGVSPQTQIERIVGFARSRGEKSFAALLPSNNFGAAVEDALRRTVAIPSGAQVALVERYDPGVGDTTPMVRRLAAYDARRMAAAAQRRELESRDDDAARIALQNLDGADAQAGVSFDSVLLPDFGDRLLQLAPLLPYYDIDPARVRFLGSALWEDPRITREPALIGAWFPAPPPEARADFIVRYKQVYGGEPPRIATLAYDAMALAAVLARSPTGPDFSAAAIANPNGFAGVDGIFRFRPDGAAERGLAVLEVQRSGFRTVSPAPKDFRELTR